MQVKNTVDGLRTVVSVCHHACERGECPSKENNNFAIKEPHVWFHTHSWAALKTFWIYYTFVKYPEIISKPFRYLNRFELIKL